MTMALPMVSKNRIHPRPSSRLCDHCRRAVAKDRQAIRATNPRRSASQVTGPPQRSRDGDAAEAKWPAGCAEALAYFATGSSLPFHPSLGLKSFIDSDKKHMQFEWKRSI